MTRFILKSMVGFFYASLFLTAMYAHYASAEKKTDFDNKIIVVEHDPYFGQVGGDIATQSSLNTIYKQLVFDGLTSYGPKGEMLPAIAKSWKISPDWSYIDFFLLDSVNFHNGDPVRAIDVKYSLDTFMRRKLRSVLRPYLRRKIKEITIEGPGHVRIHLIGSGIHYELTDGLRWGFGIFPKKYREAVGDKGFAEKPIGAGPFKAMDFKQDQWFEVEAVDRHYRKTPEYDSLRVLYVPEPNTRLAMLRAGEADIVRTTVEHAGQLLKNEKFRVVHQRHLAGSVLMFGDLAFPDKPSPFHNTKVREAVSLAIDRNTICKKVFYGLHEPYGEVLAPVSLGFDETIKPDPYNPERAKTLLKESGYPDGFKTEIHCPSHLKIEHEAIQACLAEIGIKADLQIYERGTFLRGVYGKKFKGIMRGLSWLDARRIPTEYLNAFYGTGFGMCYSTTPEIKNIIKQMQGAKSENEVTDFAKKISKMIRESRIRVHTWTIPGLWGVNKRIKNFQPQNNVFSLTMLEYIQLNR